MTTKNLLLELGTEELPPKSLRNLAQSLHDSFVKQLKDERKRLRLTTIATTKKFNSNMPLTIAHYEHYLMNFLSGKCTIKQGQYKIHFC